MQTQDSDGAPGVRRGWWEAVFHDVQFWVPLAVLLIGLALLRMAR